MQLQRSEQSVHSLGSDSSLSFSPIKRETKSVNERFHQRSFPSPSLRELSTASFSVETESLQCDESLLSCSNVPSFSTLRASLTNKEFELNTLIQYFLLLAVASQLGDLVDEIIEIVELHLHSFPILVVLGVFPQFFWKRVDARTSRTIGSHETSSIMLHSSSRSDILQTMEKYYAKKPNTEEAPNSSPEIGSPPRLRHVVATHPNDEWGHFADFDDAIDLSEESFSLPPDQGSRVILSPLHETEQDE